MKKIEIKDVINELKGNDKKAMNYFSPYKREWIGFENADHDLMRDDLDVLNTWEKNIPALIKKGKSKAFWKAVEATKNLPYWQSAVNLRAQDEGGWKKPPIIKDLEQDINLHPIGLKIMSELKDRGDIKGYFNLLPITAIAEKEFLAVADGLPRAIDFRLNHFKPFQISQMEDVFMTHFNDVNDLSNKMSEKGDEFDLAITELWAELPQRLMNPFLDYQGKCVRALDLIKEYRVSYIHNTDDVFLTTNYQEMRENKFCLSWFKFVQQNTTEKNLENDKHFHKIFKDVASDVGAGYTRVENSPLGSTPRSLLDQKNFRKVYSSIDGWLDWPVKMEEVKEIMNGEKSVQPLDLLTTIAEHTYAPSAEAKKQLRLSVLIHYLSKGLVRQPLLMAWGKKDTLKTSFVSSYVKPMFDIVQSGNQCVNDKATLDGLFGGFNANYITASLLLFDENAQQWKDERLTEQFKGYMSSYMDVARLKGKDNRSYRPMSLMFASANPGELVVSPIDAHDTTLTKRCHIWQTEFSVFENVMATVDGISNEFYARKWINEQRDLMTDAERASNYLRWILSQGELVAEAKAEIGDISPANLPNGTPSFRKTFVCEKTMKASNQNLDLITTFFINMAEFGGPMASMRDVFKMYQMFMEENAPGSRPMALPKFTKSMEEKVEKWVNAGMVIADGFIYRPCVSGNLNDVGAHSDFYFRQILKLFGAKSLNILEEMEQNRPLNEVWRLKKSFFERF